ncbi:ABC-type transport system involved in multi-copper enzyme maturation permease subunit [Enterococcus sp. PF1-24]|uniref:hypothetical protein n=1 Tax=unclassified Enterococcus TaxID=2608891 RepID=UPI00247652F2|nr:MULTISPECIES: hypothetical protein [unclassified Enterococcus]MDH6365748.1 ABC-type transport system involved in multi-copper enzyme maturation permease subunit [Enterococcus sp. PFB1-1]MDH6402848.1 ABC-type transport system involved in multi-copper enzyme maturation permease subunit [Enterococcus sp. PF1-24]
MINKQLSNLLKQRYGKAVIAGCLLFIIAGLLSGLNFANNWQGNYDYYHSKEFTETFEEFPENFTYWDENLQKEVPYESIDDFRTPTYPLFVNYSSENIRDFRSYIADKSYPEYSSELYNLRFAKDYNEDYPYEWNNQQSSFTSQPVPVIFLAIGFLLFFIDLKTSFNTLLFSSGFNRKEIFKGKILMVGVPLLAAYVVSLLAYLTVLYAKIPHEYINAPLSVFLNCIFSLLVTAIICYAAGCFIGVLTGNLIFGPLTLVGFGLVSMGLTYSINEVLFALENRPISDYTYRDILFLEFGKNTGDWQAWLSWGVLAVIILWFSQKAFTQISLEENGAYLLLPKWRLGIFLLMVTYVTSIIILPTIVDYLYPRGIMEIEPAQIIIELIILFLTILIICGSLVYSSAIKRRFIQWQDRRQGYKANS